MKKILYGFVCLTSLVAFQGCFWHSTTEKEKIVEPTSQSSTTVVTPQATTTTTNP